MTENDKESLSFELHEEDGCITNHRSNVEGKLSRLEHGNKNVDSGWAWVVLTGATVQFCIIGSILKGMGVFFNGFVDQFGSSSTVTSIIPGVFQFTYNFLSLPFLTIGLRFFSTRQLAITAGVLSGTSFIIASLANSVKVLILTYGVILVYGVISGLSTGCLFALTPAIIGDFLGMENFRSAMGILMFSEGITSGLAAPFIGYLRDVTGSYVASLYFMAACSLISAIIFFGGLLGKRHCTLSNKN